MTYNFDPDRWYEDQRLRLDFRRGSGDLSPEQYEAELEEIDRRYDEMLRRLDGTFGVGRHQEDPGGERPS